MKKISLVATGLAVLIAGMVFAGDASLSKVIKDGFDRSEKICREVEKLRGLKFKDKVKSEVQSKEDFRKFVQKSIDEQYGKDEAMWYIKALVRIGALEQEMDLAGTLTRILEGQAAAHYDPEGKKCYLLVTDVDALFLDMILSHELCHALQDQHFNLYDFIIKESKAMRDNGDAVLGRECLIEGEATWIMMGWMVMRQGAIEDLALLEPVVAMSINIQGAMDYDSVLNMAEKNVGNAALGGLTAAVQDMKNMPRYFMETIYSTYIQGAMMVNFIKSKYGWDGVGELYRKPPQSTEQVLHPEKLIERRDDPVDVRLPRLHKDLPKGWVQRDENVFGELGIKILLSMWADSAARDHAGVSVSAAGWGGDRYYFLTNKKTGGELLVWKTVWDSQQDAGEFITAYRTILPRRFPRMQKTGQSKPGDKFIYQIWEVEPGRFLKLVRNEEMVGIIDSTDRSCLEVIWK